MTDPAEDTTARTGPLAGTLVVDLTRALTGPQAAMMMGDLGALGHDGGQVTPTAHTSPPLLDERGPAVRAWLQGG